jgi:pimeloyl-ACP methyl ester carboxylesterase
MSTVADNRAEIDGLGVFWRSAPAGDRFEGAPPVLYLHGVPSNSDDWVTPHARRQRRPRWQRFWRRKRSTDEWIERPAFQKGFLEHSGGLAPDLPGFGRSAKPGDLEYTIDEYSRAFWTISS